MKLNHKIQLLIPLLALLAGACSPGSSSPQNLEKIVHLIIDNNPELDPHLTENLIHEVSRKVRSHYLLGIEQVRNTGVYVLLTAPGNRQSVKEIIPELDGNPKTPILEPIPSDETALPKMFQRCIDKAHKAKADSSILFCVIVTPGTSNRQVISQLHLMSQSLVDKNLNKQIRLYLIGVNPKYRFQLTDGFAPLEEQVAIASHLDTQWLPFIKEALKP